MVKTLFPLNRTHEEFENPDKKFNSLPYSDEIPDMTTRSIKTPPFTYHYWSFRTCREQVCISGLVGWVLGWSLLGYYLAEAKFGYNVNRWRLFWCQAASASFTSVVAMVQTAFHQPACSPYLTGRRRPMFDEEVIRHELNARFRLFENVEKIMHTHHKISKQEFYETFFHIDDN